MKKLSTIDYLVIDSLVAQTSIVKKPIIVSQQELCSITKLKAIQVSMSLRKLHTAQLLVVIWFDDDAHIQLYKANYELLKNAQQMEVV